MCYSFIVSISEYLTNLASSLHKINLYIPSQKLTLTNNHYVSPNWSLSQRCTFKSLENPGRNNIIITKKSFKVLQVRVSHFCTFVFFVCFELVLNSKVYNLSFLSRSNSDSWEIGKHVEMTDSHQTKTRGLKMASC